MISGDTIAAIATAPGRGGVAVVRVSGSESFGYAERLSPADPDDSDATAPGRGGDRSNGITRYHLPTLYLNERKNFRISSAVVQAVRRL